MRPKLILRAFLPSYPCSSLAAAFTTHNEGVQRIMQRESFNPFYSIGVNRSVIAVTVGVVKLAPCRGVC